MAIRASAFTVTPCPTAASPRTHIGMSECRNVTPENALGDQKHERRTCTGENCATPSAGSRSAERPIFKTSLLVRPNCSRKPHTHCASHFETPSRVLSCWSLPNASFGSQSEQHHGVERGRLVDHECCGHGITRSLDGGRNRHRRAPDGGGFPGARRLRAERRTRQSPPGNGPVWPPSGLDGTMRHGPLHVGVKALVGA